MKNSPGVEFSWIVRFALVALGLGLAARLGAAEETVPPALVGRWSGEGRITPDVLKTGVIPLSFEIRADGRVSGRAGEAEFTGGRLERVRTTLVWRVDRDERYQVQGASLSGPIVAAAGLVAPRFGLSLTFSSGRVTLATIFVRTSQRDDQKPANLVLSARELTKQSEPAPAPATPSGPPKADRPSGN